MKVGEQIEVTLPETATTGYLWHSEVAEGLREVSDERVASTVPRGAPGVRRITFEAVRPGDAVLRFVKRRPWESEATDEFSVRLHVGPGER